PDEHVEQYRERTCRGEGEKLRQELAEWAASVASRIGDPWPTMPAGVYDRPADVWEPLLAVADAAGGHWPKRAREACRWFVAGARDQVVSLGVRLLADVRELFGDRDRMSSAELCKQLAAMEEAPWGDMYGKPIDQRRLSRLLGQYGVHSTKIRIGNITVRGYVVEDLADVWRRYLDPAVSPGSGTDGTNGTLQVSTVPDAFHVADGSGTRNTSGTGLTSDVPDVPAVAVPGQLQLADDWDRQLYDR